VLLAKGVKGVEQQQEGRVNDMMDPRLTLSRGGQQREFIPLWEVETKANASRQKKTPKLSYFKLCMCIS
jgi:hypothetical protein